MHLQDVEVLVQIESIWISGAAPASANRLIVAICMAFSFPMAGAQNAPI